MDIKGLLISGFCPVSCGGIPIENHWLVICRKYWDSTIPNYYPTLAQRFWLVHSCITVPLLLTITVIFFEIDRGMIAGDSGTIVENVGFPLSNIEQLHEKHQKHIPKCQLVYFYSGGIMFFINPSHAGSLLFGLSLITL